jgi:hypothetical protein
LTQNATLSDVGLRRIIALAIGTGSAYQQAAKDKAPPGTEARKAGQGRRVRKTKAMEGFSLIEYGREKHVEP